ncbi:hypothetical protein A3D11_03690 [Candidatus Peribacteria bacterium RIFCSPHIGHO2_02_FULL_49_16]|nr:MAG: hypothetical protein A2880_04650 [Candidatus Peribacteria bacterium RIFCSPHIGHO2_01_FULL_49_38]OGJ58836.1 MAG: hypothetical protein A3D11_03690 [Candidatus Peribacteria bacterium RIFCSPHIGHO2_02_FULL_49_16]
MLFTTSWDDGYASDMRLADLLMEHECTGTFYICPKPQYGKEMLSKHAIGLLAQRHEIGAHTLTHPDLTRIPIELAQEEIQRSKIWVETVSQKPCTMFCYPYGAYNEHVKNFVKEAGFFGARITENFHCSGNDPFALPASIQFYPFPLRRIFNRRCIGPLQKSWKPLRSLGIPLTSLRAWLPMAKVVFQKMYESEEPWFHLWGHSQEIDRYGMWSDLEKFLKFVKGFENTKCVPNSSLIPTTP